METIRCDWDEKRRVARAFDGCQTEHEIIATIFFLKYRAESYHCKTMERVARNIMYSSAKDAYARVKAL